MILNELSLKNVNNEHDMIKMMTDFLSLCKKLKNEIKDDEFYYTDEIFYKNENKNVYTISDWLKSDKVAKREKQYFRMLINRSNIIKKSDFVESELFIVSGVGENLSFTGGLVSYELDDYIVSLLTEKLWEEFIVKAQYISIENEDREVEIKNCSSDKHIKQIIKIKREQQGIIISSGKELWEKREVLYPHLVFCDEVKEFFGQIEVTNNGERFCFKVPDAGVEYVHENMAENEFICGLVKLVSGHGCTIEKIREYFLSYNNDIHYEKTKNGEFDYLLYFNNGIPDKYYYCFTVEECHVIYHRFLKHDYEDFGF